MANGGFLRPRQSGKYERDSVVEWFVAQEDLLSRFKVALKVNLRGLSLAKASEIFNTVLKSDFEDCEDATADDAQRLTTLEDDIRHVTPGAGCRKRRGPDEEDPDWYIPPKSTDEAGAHRPQDLRSYLLDRFGIQWPDKGGTIFRLMHHEAVGASYDSCTKCYYTDTHERHLQYRCCFLERDAENETYQHKFIVLPEKEANALIEEHKKENDNAERDLDPWRFTDERGNKCVEFNVNASAAFEGFINAHRMGGDLSRRKYPKGKPEEGDAVPVVNVGQDEKTYAAFAYPKKCWTIGNETFMLPKTEGPKQMCSGFVSRCTFFGFPVTQEQLDAINEHRKGEDYPIREGTDVGEAWVRIQKKKSPDSLVSAAAASESSIKEQQQRAAAESSSCCLFRDFGDYRQTFVWRFGDYRQTLCC